MLKLPFFYFNHCLKLSPIVINCSSWIGQINVCIIALSQNQCEKGGQLLVWRDREQGSDLHLYLKNVIIYICKSSEYTAYPEQVHSVQFSLVTQSCPTLYDPMNHSTPGLPVHHQLPEFTQTHVHWVGDAIKPSHPLSSPSLPAFNLSQHWGLFK